MGGTQAKRSNTQNCRVLTHAIRHSEPLNPILPSAPFMARLEKIYISIFERIVRKISYERRDYESVDEKSLA